VRRDEDELRVRLEGMKAEVEALKARTGELWAGVLEDLPESVFVGDGPRRSGGYIGILPRTVSPLGLGCASG
jgi:hypothetical protein